MKRTSILLLMVMTLCVILSTSIVFAKHWPDDPGIEPGTFTFPGGRTSPYIRANQFKEQVREYDNLFISSETQVPNSHGLGNAAFPFDIVIIVSPLQGGGGGGDTSVEMNWDQLRDILQQVFQGTPQQERRIIMNNPDAIISSAMNQDYSIHQSISLNVKSSQSSSSFNIIFSMIHLTTSCFSKLKELILGNVIVYIFILYLLFNINDILTKYHHFLQFIYATVSTTIKFIKALLKNFISEVLLFIQQIWDKIKPLPPIWQEGCRKQRWRIWAIARAPPN